MKITLPDKTDQSAPDVLNTSAGHAVIIGANGAGKTRFSRFLAQSLGDKAFTLNVVDALFNSTETGGSTSDIAAIYNASIIPTYEKERRQTDLERLLALLINDELVNLLNHKFVHPGSELRRTRLDRLIEMWHRIFPDNRVLVDNGRLLFSSAESSDLFPARRLSHGERAVLYYGAAILYAPEHAIIFADSPEMFLHPATMQSLWNELEDLRPDCTIIYVTHDLEFAASRTGAPVIWVRACDTANSTWDYSVMPPQDSIDDKLYMAILGERRSVLFIEGDQRSIDSRLYPLIFPDKSVKPLGSCNKVIESTRTFNDLNGLHHMSAMGIVDRDRRDIAEVAYLRRKNIMVPEVAEIENILLLPEVIRAVAKACGKDPAHVFSSVCRSILSMLRHDLRQQALMHTRHRVKKIMEYRIDGRFQNIGELEKHINDLVIRMNPRQLYESFCKEFHKMLSANDYNAILQVYNQKSMLSGCNVAGLCGLHNKEEYIDTIMDILRGDAPEAPEIRRAVRNALRADADYSDGTGK